MIAQHRDSGDENDMVQAFGPFTLIFDPPTQTRPFGMRDVWQCAIKRPGWLTNFTYGDTKQEAREDALQHIGRALREEVAS